MPRASVNGINIYYQVHGQGEPLVLVTGLGADHSTWFRQLPAFRKHYRVITFDSRGVGRTDIPEQPWDLKTMAEDAVGLMDHLGIDKAHILGLSLGGMIAQEIAINHPERVKKLILASTDPGKGDPNDMHPEMMKAFGLRDASDKLDIRQVDVTRSTKAMISLSFNKRLYRWLMPFLARGYIKSASAEGFLKQLEAISDHDRLDRLHLIKAPTLVITGTEDKIISPHQSEVMASTIPNARLVMVQGGSHAWNFEMSGRFNREVLAFLRAA